MNRTKTGGTGDRHRVRARAGRTILCALGGAALLLALAAGCDGGGGDRPVRPDGPAVWVEPSAAALDGEAARMLNAAGVEEVFLEAASLVWQGESPLLGPIVEAFGGAVPRGTPVTLVVRGPLSAGAPAGGEAGETDPEAAGEALAASLRELALDAEEHGLLPLGVHLEPVGGPGGLPDVELLRAVRSGIGADLLLSTALPRDALGSEESVEAAATTARAVDFVVVTLYGHPGRAADDPAAWSPERVQGELAALEALGTDFLARLHVVGSARHLSSAGEPASGGAEDEDEGVSTRTPLAALALDPALRLDIDPFGGNGRLLYTFEAQRPARVPVAGPSARSAGGSAGEGAGGGWRLAPGESVRVSRTSPPLVRWILDTLEESGLETYAGPLFHRVAGPDELLGFEAAEIAAALGARSAAPEIGWRAVVQSRSGNSIVIEIELVNRGRQSTDLATTEANYLEVRARDGHFVAVEPGDFSRYSLWRGDQEARPGVGWRKPDGVRLSTPLVDGGDRIGGAMLTLRTAEAAPRLEIGGRFVLTGGEVLELPKVEGRLESSLGGPSADDGSAEEDE